MIPIAYHSGVKRGVPRDGEGRTVGERVDARADAFGQLRRLGEIWRRRRIRRRNIAEVLLDPGTRLHLAEVADDREHGVVGCVVRAEERCGVGE
jgi:hypothetical protein